jgi:hypothetical protein
VFETRRDQTRQNLSIYVENWVSEESTFLDFEEFTMTTAVMKRGDVETHTVYIVAGLECHCGSRLR